MLLMLPVLLMLLIVPDCAGELHEGEEADWVTIHPRSARQSPGQFRGPLETGQSIPLIPSIQSTPSTPSAPSPPSTPSRPVPVRMSLFRR